MPQYLTTKEVAELLRVKERKVYDLAAAGEIPHRRLTGKLLFPAEEIAAWIEGTAAAPARAAERPALLVGSHDPLLDWALRESGSGLASLIDGSRDGLARFARGEAALAGLHIPEPEGWNLASVAAEGLTGAVLIAWASRARGLVLARGLEGRVAGAGDLAGLRVAPRQPGAGAQALLERLLAEAGTAPEALAPCPGIARTESDAAAAVATGEADAAIGLEALARQYRLGFLPLLAERFDLLIDRRAYFTEPVQRLLGFARSPAFAEKAAALGGYDLAEQGRVRWLSP